VIAFLLAWVRWPTCGTCVRAARCGPSNLQIVGKHRIVCAAFSEDGKRLILGSLDTVLLFDVVSGKPIRQLRGGFIGSVSLSGDGQQALVASYDTGAVLWDVETGKQIQRFGDGTTGIVCALLTRSGDLVLTGCSDGATRIWDVKTGRELCRHISLDDGKEWLVVTPEGLFDGSAGAPRHLSYRIAGTLEFVSLDKYLHRYYTPGLLSRLLKGERPAAKIDIARALPPRVRLVSPAAALDVKHGKLLVKAEAESRGEHPVTALRLMLDNRPYQGDKGIHRLRGAKPGKVEASWDVELAPGRHEVKVLADTALVRGVPSETVEVRYTGGGVKVELPRLFVLAVGISEYRDKTLKLDYAAGDAAAVAEAYQTWSRKLYRETPTTRVLRDVEATRKGIIEGLLWLRDNVKQGDYAVFHFAGHGRKDKTGALFFLPHEADVKDLDNTAISSDDGWNLSSASDQGRIGASSAAKLSAVGLAA
jgi:hypothetical protein